MKPPYQISELIINQVSSISEKIGEIKAHFLSRPSPHLRKQNKIRTIHSSLKIEGNTLSLEQVTAIVDNKRVLGGKTGQTDHPLPVKIDHPKKRPFLISAGAN